MKFRKAALLALVPALAAALAAAADPDPLSLEHFVKVSADGKDVVAVRLAAPAGTDGGFVAWFTPEGTLKVSPGAALTFAPGAQSSETTLVAKKINARLAVKWGKNEMQSGVFKTNRTAKVSFVDKNDELELHVVLLAPEGTEKDLRGALCFRVLRGEKIVDSGSAVFTATAGKPSTVSVASKGPALSLLVDVPSEE